MAQILNYSREYKSHDEIDKQIATQHEIQQDISAQIQQLSERQKNVVDTQRNVRSELFKRLKSHGVHVQPSREDILKQIKVLRHAGGNTNDDYSFVTFDDFVYQLDILQAKIPPYEVIYSGMDLTPIPTKDGIAYTHRDGDQPVYITSAGDVQMCPDDTIHASVPNTHQPVQKDRFNDLYENYLSKQYDQSVNVQFDQNVCKDSIQSAEQFVLKLLMNNYSEIDLMSVMSKWLLCPMQKTINNIIDQWNAVASFLMHIFVPIFNKHIHTTPVGPTSAPTSQVTSFGDIPKWYKLPYVCFVEEFAYKVESAKRDKLCVQPFLNKTYTCGDKRQLDTFLSKYSDQLAMEIVGEHQDDPKVKMMRESGQWKKFSMYDASTANFVLLKVHEVPNQIVQPLDSELFDKLKYILQPVVNIPDDIFLFCGDFADGILDDINKLVQYANALSTLKTALSQFIEKCNYGTVSSTDVSSLSQMCAQSMKSQYITSSDIDLIVSFIQNHQQQQDSEFLSTLVKFKSQLKTGSTSEQSNIQLVFNGQFIISSKTQFDQHFAKFGVQACPKANNLAKLVSKVQMLFDIDQSVLYKDSNSLTLNVLNRTARFVHTYRSMKHQPYPLNGSGAVDEDIIKQVG